MVNRGLDEAVAAGRAKSSATSKVGNVSKRAKVRLVRRCTAMEDLVYQDSNLGYRAWEQCKLTQWVMGSPNCQEF